MSSSSSNTVRNRDPAPIQLTAEQLLREAKERQNGEVKTTVQKIQNSEELAEWRFLKRRGFEGAIKNQKTCIGNYVKYARWEETQGEFERARNIFERALDVDHTATPLWLKYAAFETRNKFINRARNVYDRAVTILPRVNQLWRDYVYLQEMVGDILAARTVFERWMKCFPGEDAWAQYIKFEERCGRMEAARKLYERMIEQIPEQVVYIRYAKWEERQGNKANCRSIFERSLVELSAENVDEDLYLEFAKFEVRCQELERARAIYQFGLKNVIGTKETLNTEYTMFEKQFGNRETIESAILSKRKEQYETLLTSSPYNYDGWFDYIKMLEQEGNVKDVIDVYERAVSNVPPSKEKRFWRRYIYLWIYYAVYMEYDVEDEDKTREVYKKALEVIPHKHFTFGKIWILFAQFELRHNHLDQARKILGQSIGRSPKTNVFTFYIDMEYRLMNLDRCRTLYQKMLECNPSNCKAWCDYAEFEKDLEENERAAAIFELAINQEMLDTPEIVWKKYIDLMMEMGNEEKVEELFERLLEKAPHSKVFMSYSQYESTIDIDKARAILERGISLFKENDEGEMRHQLLLALKSLEESLDNNEDRIKAVTARQARKVHKVRHDELSGLDEGYIDYVFPDDEVNSTQLNMLKAASLWKKGMSMKKEKEKENGVAMDMDVKRVKVDKDAIDLEDDE